MKITLTGILAGPDGVALPGTVLDVPQQRADEMLKQRAARPFDADRDKNAKRGLSKPEPIAT